MIMNFIEWCNANQGFLSAILAMTSIALSVVAIFVSINVAKLPFKKKIAVAFFTNLGVGMSRGVSFYSVEATNIGNRIIKVSFVGVGYKENGKWHKFYNIQDPNANANNVMLSINESVSVVYEIDKLTEWKKEKTLYAMAIDVEGKIYKKRIK